MQAAAAPAIATGGAGEIVHRYRQLGAVLLDPDVGDDELRVRLLSTVPEAQLREDHVRPGELDAGRPQGPLRADGRAARRAAAGIDPPMDPRPGPFRLTLCGRLNGG